ncbi:hypothetical protein Ancab_039919 [Ancistrocladus abbreviatus]
MARVAGVASANVPQYDRKAEIKAFDETKAGVKGLLDAGVTQLPRIFIKEQPQLLDHLTVEEEPLSNIPIIDLHGGNNDAKRRKETVREISDAFKSWGLFQIVNHGIPHSMLDEIRESVKRFHELDTDMKKPYYSRDYRGNKKFIFNCNFFLEEGPVTNWRDTLVAFMAPDPVDPQDFPEVCEDTIIQYSKEVTRLGHTLFELLSEVLGLPPNYLKDMDFAEQLMVMGHYYPPCPVPEKAIGINNHTDNDVLTILLQDHIGGLQVLHHDKWVEVPYVPGALVVNTGDLLQLVSNDKLKSVVHRVQPKKVGPRISVAAFFRPAPDNPRLLGPIKEIVSENNPPVYRACTTKEHTAAYVATGQDGTSALDKFKLR